MVHALSACNPYTRGRDMVESFELEVPYVVTADNPADFFTKTVKNATRFRELHNIVMNIRE